ncbi:MAG: TlpA disulfide reductase family protein [Burkholderiales bacterium]|nr:TlpA disulfide reductase family protein [Burkholderiales bacterium]
MNRRHLLQTGFAAALASPMLLRAQPAATVAPATLAGSTLEGRPYDMKAEQGKVVLVFFWSTDCAVCRDKMPELRLNYEAWRGKGFQLVAVSIDKSLAAVQDYQGILDRMVPPAQRFPSLWRGSAAHRDSFGPMVQTPTTFVLDRQHKMVKEIRGRIPPGLWDDVAELVLA